MRCLSGVIQVLICALLLGGCGKTEQTSGPQEGVSEPLTAELADKSVAQKTAAVLDISAQLYQGRLAAAVTLSAPVAADQSLSSWLEITQKNGAILDSAWRANDKGSVLYFTGLEPETDYQVTVHSGLPFSAGNHLEQARQQTITTPALQPMLGFVGGGNLVAHQLAQGLPVMAANINQVDVDFYQIPTAKLADFLWENQQRGPLNFWRVRDELDNYPLVYSGRFDLDLDKNTQGTRYLPIKAITPLQKSGVYLAVMRESGAYRYDYPATWFAVTDLGVQVKRYQEQLDVVVNHLATAEPAAEVELSLLDAQGKSVQQQRTSARGFARFDITRNSATSAQLLLAQKGQDTTLVRLYGSGLDLSEFPISGASAQEQNLFIYAPRDLYRPGERVTLSALLRDRDGRMLPAQVLEASLQQPDGRTVMTQRLTAQVLNYYEVSFALADDAPTGQWRVAIQLADGSISEYPLQVEEFLPERMALTVQTDARTPVNQPAQLAVTGHYLYGAQAAGNRLQVRMNAKVASHPFTDYPDYHFGNVQQTRWDRQDELEPRNLDDTGKAQVEIPAFWQQLDTPLQLTFYASLQDTGGRAVKRSASTTLLPAQSLIGIRPLFADDHVDYDSRAAFELVYTDGIKQQPLEQARVRLIREERRYHWVYSDDDGWHSDYTEHHYPVVNQSIDLTAEQLAQIELPVEWGYYRVEVEHPTNGVIASYRFQAGWAATSDPLAGRPDRIALTLDQAAYLPGGQATVNIKPPAAGKGYLVVEGDRPLYWQAIDIPAEGASITLPVDKEWARHDLYLSVTLIQPGLSRDSLLPRRMMGIHPLPIDRHERQLDVAMTLPEHASPRSRVRIPVQISQPRDQSEPLKLTLAAVDVGVLSLTDFATPDPFDGFFGQRRYQVENRDSYSDLIKGEAGDMARLRFGGDADLNRGGSEPATDVHIVALFSGVVDVDDQGRAEVELDLPDVNGRLRLMAVAFSDTAYGAAEAELPVRAPLVTQLTMPRFLAQGDQSQLALDLHNLSGTDQTLDLQLTLGEGLQAQTPALLKQTVNLADQQKTTLLLGISAPAVAGRYPISLTLSGLQNVAISQPIQQQWWLPVRPAWPEQEQRWQVKLAPGEQFSLAAEQVKALWSQQRQLSLAAAARPVLDVSSHLQALLAYPYGCLEQTTSGVFAQLYSDPDVLAQLQLSGETQPHRQQAIMTAIQRILGMQHRRGGFGLWSANSPEEYWLSVYVSDFLLRARERGYSVPSENLRQALERLAEYLRNPEQTLLQVRDKRRQWEIAAYAGQLLSRVDQAPLSALRQLADNQPDQVSGLSQLQLGLALLRRGDDRRGQQLLQQGTERLLNGPLKHAPENYASPVRDLALALFWSIENQQLAAQWPALLARLQQTLQARQWLSTQERNAVFLAGQQWLQLPAEPVQLQVNQGDTTQPLTDDKPVRFNPAEQPLQVINPGDTAAYLEAVLSGYSRQPPVAQDNGIRVTRRWLDLKGQPLTDVNLRSGQLILVELAYQTEQRMAHLLIADLLPAGLEVENQNLADAVPLEAIQRDGQSLASYMQALDIRYQAYRDDRYVVALDTRQQREGRLYYLARAVSPGVYTQPPTFAEDMYQPQQRHLGTTPAPLRISR